MGRGATSLGRTLSLSLAPTPPPCSHLLPLGGLWTSSALPTPSRIPAVKVPFSWADVGIWAKSRKDADFYSSQFTYLAPGAWQMGMQFTSWFSRMLWTPQHGGGAASVTGAVAPSRPPFCIRSVLAAFTSAWPQTPSPYDAHCNKNQAVRLSLGYYFYLALISFVLCHLYCFGCISNCD